MVARNCAIFWQKNILFESNMNILILTPYLPYPLSSGGAQGVFNMVNQLRHKHHYTFVISEGRDYDINNVKALKTLWPEVDIIYYPLWRQMLYPRFVYDRCRRVMLKKFAPKSRKLMIEMAVRPYGEWFSKHHVSFIEKIVKIKHIDLVQVDFYECLPWSNYLPGNVRKIFIHHELGFIRKQRLLKNVVLTQKEQQQLELSKKKEISDLNQYNAVVTVTETDKHILEKEGVKPPIFVSTSAINTESSDYCVTPNQLIFVGAYGHEPNKEGIDWFVKKVTPFLKDEKLTMNLVGKSWPQIYENCQNVNIKIKGFVEHLTDIASGTIMIVPILSGSGMRMKILEGAAMSLPIVTTTVGVEGLDFKDGESCIVADKPEDFANAIIQLGKDEQYRKKLGENANKQFHAKYHPSVLAEERNKIYQKVINL